MTGSHSHSSHRAGDELDVAPLPRKLLLGSLVIAAILTVIGLVALWPDGDRVDEIQSGVSFAAPGVTFPNAEVSSVQGRCASAEETECEQITATVLEGDGEGQEVVVRVPPEVVDSGIGEGDTIKLLRTPETGEGPATYGYFGTDRTLPVALLLGALVLVTGLVAGWRGLRALLGLGVGIAVIVFFILPALLSGSSGVLVGAVGCSAIMLLVLYGTHGVSLRTSAALAGTLGGIVMMVVLGEFAVNGATLTGISDDGDRVLSSFAEGLSFQNLLACAIVVAGLGALNDVTITQASAVWEIRAAAPAMSRRGVFASGMRIGRDHIASTIYTIVFAYAGAALTVLLVLSLYDRPLVDLLATEEIGQEVVRTLATSIGLVLTMPLTTAIAAVTLPRAKHVVESAQDPADAAP